MSYCTRDQVRALAQGMTSSGAPPASDSLVDDLIERISRLFDLECGVSNGYFEANTAAASARTFYGEGIYRLKLDPYVAGSLTSVTLPDGYSAPDYVERDGYLIRTSADHVLPSMMWWRWYWWGWDIGVPVTVTAKWGFSATPPEVQGAIIEWVINVWRETDPAGIKLVGLDGQVLRETVPPRVAEVIKLWTFNVGSMIV